VQEAKKEANAAKRIIFLSKEDFAAGTFMPIQCLVRNWSKIFKV
jgi:hypothetical protein